MPAKLNQQQTVYVSCDECSDFYIVVQTLEAAEKLVDNHNLKRHKKVRQSSYD